MKLLDEYDHVEQAEAVAKRLEDAGVAAFVSSRYNNSLARPIRNVSLAAGLWVVLDRQYDDAVRLLEHPDHRVADPLSPESLAELKASVTNPDLSTVLSFLLKLLVGAAILLAAVAALNVYWPAE